MFFRKEQEKARKLRNLLAEAGMTVLRVSAGSESSLEERRVLPRA